MPARKKTIEKVEPIIEVAEDIVEPPSEALAEPTEASTEPTANVEDEVVSIDEEISANEDEGYDDFEYHDDERYDQIFGVIAASLQTGEGVPLADVLQDISTALEKQSAIAEGTNKILFRIAKLLEQRR